MKRILLMLILCTVNYMGIAQSTALKVYNVLQEKCASCHGNDNPSGNLDFVGTGASLEQKALSVYTKLYNKNPSNVAAVAKGDKLIYPGRPDRSFFFRKIAKNFETTIDVDSVAGEGVYMPSSPYIPELTQSEKELIRQWILFNAPTTGNIPNEQYIDEYYSGNGQAAFPDGPPPAPAVGEGFQIRMGPFFLAPQGQVGDELEYYQKYELNLPENVEVNRLDMQQSGYSHHFIMYHFNSSAGSNAVSAGLRTNANHYDIGLTAAIQEATDLKLPQGTAFKWLSNKILDLNSHYINYSATMVYKAEVYVNVYTQPNGIAAQEMKTTLEANLNIAIPGDGNPVTISDPFYNNAVGNVYVWGLMGHTHKWGTGYKIFERNTNNTKGDLLYDGACPQGTPGCIAPNFDYQHIPLRYFTPLHQVNMSGGFIHEATWENDSGQTLFFGPTSDDEMMVMIIMYTADTTGIIYSKTTEPDQQTLKGVNVYPNPVSNMLNIQMPESIQAYNIQIFDVFGNEVILIDDTTITNQTIDCNKFANGFYFWRIRSKEGKIATGKFSVVH